MKKKQGRTLIGILVVMALIAGGAAYFYGPGKPGETTQRADGKGNTVIGKSALAAKDVVCRQQLGQVRASIQINTDHVDNIFPPNLDALKLPAEFEKCPVGGEAYIYNPEAGLVYCPHPGHEKY